MEIDYKISRIQTLDDLEEGLAKNELKNLIKKGYVKGILLWGSRATQFGEIDTDYDALIYVNQDYFNTLKKNEIAILKFNESVKPKKLLIDFTYWSDSIFEDQLQSPLDIDHSAYEEGVILYDNFGELEIWRKKLAHYPMENHHERIRVKWINLMVSFGYASKNSLRNNILDMKINLIKTLTIAVNIFFNLKNKWAPPLKWWTKYAIKAGMDQELFNLYSTALYDIAIENTKILIDKLKVLIEASGIKLDNFVDDFLETIYPNGRKKLISYSYF
jgi:predicted nucleotidyltransferase